MTEDIELLLDYLLEDDSTKCGGVSFYGETLRNFMEECDLPIGTPLNVINEALSECGIKKIKG